MLVRLSRLRCHKLISLSCLFFISHAVDSISYFLMENNYDIFIIIIIAAERHPPPHSYRYGSPKDRHIYPSCPHLAFLIDTMNINSKFYMTLSQIETLSNHLVDMELRYYLLGTQLLLVRISLYYLIIILFFNKYTEYLTLLDD